MMAYTRGVCKRGHNLTVDNLVKVGLGRVRCKICRRRISRESKRRVAQRSA